MSSIKWFDGDSVQALQKMKDENCAFFVYIGKRFIFNTFITFITCIQLNILVVEDISCVNKYQIIITYFYFILSTIIQYQVKKLKIT